MNLESVFGLTSCSDRSLNATVGTTTKVFRSHKEVVREWIGPVASCKVESLVKRLPKARSGKILRGTVKKIADGVDYRIPPTIDDPVILDEITSDLAALGYPGNQSEKRA